MRYSLRMAAHLLVPALVGALLQTSPGEGAQHAGVELDPAGFAFDVARLAVADGWLAARTPYPTPHLVDVDGDGSRELLIGDLKGHVRVSRRPEGAAPFVWGPPEDLATDGRLLKFHNW